MSTGRLVLTGLCFVVGVLALGWLVQGNNFFMYKTFAPMWEDARRETFENTKSYRTGTIQELESFQVEYLKASDESKSALRKIILRRVAGFDMTKDDVSPELRDFVAGLKKEELN